MQHLEKIDLYSIGMRSTGIYGIPEGIMYGQNERIDELNDRISARAFPDEAMQMNFDPRPVPTKYSLFPIIDRRQIAREPIHMKPYYNIEQTFSAPSRKPHCSGYFSNIDKEADLRNHGRYLEKGGMKNMYTPSIEGDLYRVHVPSGSITEKSSTLLSTTYKFTGNTFDYNIGNDTFHNNTRTQMRNM